MARAGAALGWLSTALALALAAALFFRPLLPLPRPTHYVGGDFLSYFYPIYHYVAEEVAAGRLPHWTPFVGAGYPLLADIEAGVLYPPARLLGLLAGPPSYVTLELYALAHYLVAGLGMLALGSQAGLGPLPAGVGALVLMLSGFLWAHAAHLSRRPRSPGPWSPAAWWRCSSSAGTRRSRSTASSRWDSSASPYSGGAGARSPGGAASPCPPSPWPRCSWAPPSRARSSP
jgi:hypothetical protein